MKQLDEKIYVAVAEDVLNRLKDFNDLKILHCIKWEDSTKLLRYGSIFPVEHALDFSVDTFDVGIVDFIEQLKKEFERVITKGNVNKLDISSDSSGKEKGIAILYREPNLVPLRFGSLEHPSKKSFTMLLAVVEA